jgi:hypothetical protein
MSAYFFHFIDCFDGLLLSQNWRGFIGRVLVIKEVPHLSLGVFRHALVVKHRVHLALSADALVEFPEVIEDFLGGTTLLDHVHFDIGQYTGAAARMIFEKGRGISLGLYVVIDLDFVDLLHQVLPVTLHVSHRELPSLKCVVRFAFLRLDAFLVLKLSRLG